MPLQGYRYWELERRVCCAMARHDLAAAWRQRRQHDQGTQEQSHQQQQQQQQPQQAEEERKRQGAPCKPGTLKDPGKQATCSPAPALATAAPVPLDPGFTWPDALAAHEAKSFDYRLLHLLLHRLAGTEYDEALLAFMAADERLVDIGDDLTDYEGGRARPVVPAG
jgi:hypothetical protein